MRTDLTVLFFLYKYKLYKNKGKFNKQITSIFIKLIKIDLKYVCINLYSLPFTGFESLPESVQTNLSKSPRNPQVICPATWSLFPGGH